MVERLVNLILEYQAKVLEAALLFEKYKGINQSDLMYARSNGLPKDGFLDPEQRIEYYFHGIGCCVTFPNGSVDWDFGYDGRLNGFDAWRLWVFVEEGTNDFPEFKQKETLDKAFVEAINQGIIHTPFKNLQDDLHYLTIEKES